MALRDLNSEERKQAIQLAAILRLANAMDAGHDGHIRRVEVKNANGSGKPACIQIAAEGFSARNANAQAVAAERYLLETILRRPVMIAAASGLRRPAAGKPQTRHA